MKECRMDEWFKFDLFNTLMIFMQSFNHAGFNKNIVNCFVRNHVSGMVT